jgi:2-polyprenyl-3-methyl-5-hydroxy-6-metoxy-1,4-benzoquinol methylase
MIIPFEPLEALSSRDTIAAVPTREDVRRLAYQSIARGDATGWFEDLYRGAAGRWSDIPWVNLRANPYLLNWLESRDAHASGRTCLVVGCGLGDDAEALSGSGYEVIAFDVSRTAIEGCRSRYPASNVQYVAADLFDLPRGWMGHFDFVFEANTLQVLPSSRRPAALKTLADLVASRGRLLVVCRARDDRDPEGELPWPLSHEELNALCNFGLSEIEFESFIDDEPTPVRRFRALYERRQS